MDRTHSDRPHACWPVGQLSHINPRAIHLVAAPTSRLLAPLLASGAKTNQHLTAHQPLAHCIRAPPRGGRYWEIHPRRPISRDPRDFPRAKPEGNLEGRGKSERFSEAVGFAPRDPRDFPRAKPEGNPEGRGVQNPRPRKISRAEGMDFPIPPESWWSTDILSSLPGKD